MPDISPDYWTQNSNWLLRRWRACEDDVIGAWCVLREEDKRTPAEGAVPIAAFVTRDVADHIAHCHNLWLIPHRNEALRALERDDAARAFDVEHDVS